MVAQFAYSSCAVYSNRLGVIHECIVPCRSTAASAVWGGLWRRVGDARLLRGYPGRRDERAGPDPGEEGPGDDLCVGTSPAKLPSESNGSVRPSRLVAQIAAQSTA